MLKNLLLISMLPICLFGKEPVKNHKAPDMFTNIPTTRPRLFFTPEIIAQRRAKLTPFQAEFVDALKARIGQLDINPEVNLDKGTSHNSNDYGHNAAYAALLWLLTDEPAYRDKGIAWLSWFTDWTIQRFAEQKPVSWYCYSRIASLCAYDWLYNAMSEEQRTDIGNRMLKHLRDTLDTHTIFSYNGEGSSGATAGFYGTRNLWWYAGIVFHKTGLDEELAQHLLSEGYTQHLQMFEYRAKLAGTDGGPLTQSEGYVLGDYWKQEFRFFYAWKALFGENYSDKTPCLAGPPLWISYCAILPKEPSLEANVFGSGDCRHFGNNLQLPAAYLLQFPHFYKDSHPHESAIAAWLYKKCGPEVDAKMLYYFTANTMCGTPGAPLLFEMVENTPQEPSLDHAKFYRGIGMVYMRSGNSPDDTYVLFTAGGSNLGHKHYDEGNFIVYKRGYQVMDTGARLIYSGMPKNERFVQNCYHNSNYFNRTIAHNCLLIEQPDEDFGIASQPNGVKVKLVNDGGMRQRIGSKMLHYECNDRYTYCHADLTAPYASSKAKSIIRQFLFLYPNTIVVRDTVESVKPEYRKAFILHPGQEPTLAPQAASPEAGASYVYGNNRVTALLPAKANLEIIGGPGKEYWVAGQNWPTAPEDDADKKNKGFLYGDWRVETRPATDANAKEEFLHVIELDASQPGPTLHDDGSITLHTGTGKTTIRFSDDTVTVEN